MIIMKKISGIAVLGGDTRQLIAARRLRESGYEVYISGFGGEIDKNCSYDRAAVDSACCSACRRPANGLYPYIGEFVDLPTAEAVEEADAILLPLPAFSDNGNISMPYGSEDITAGRLIKLASDNDIGLIFGGMMSAVFAEQCESVGIDCFDYYAEESFAVANAIPTAEGAIAIAMNELPITLNRSSALIVGYGRIGRVLAKLLKSLGVDVTVAARSQNAKAWIKAEGYRPIDISDLCDFIGEGRPQVIYNTVPHRIIGENELKKLPGEGLIIDLASKPGGVDIEAAGALNSKVIWALSLPGKVAPVTSGEIIAETVNDYLNRRRNFK